MLVGVVLVLVVGSHTVVPALAGLLLARVDVLVFLFCGCECRYFLSRVDITDVVVCSSVQVLCVRERRYSLHQRQKLPSHCEQRMRLTLLGALALATAVHPGQSLPRSSSSCNGSSVNLTAGDCATWQVGE